MTLALSASLTSVAVAASTEQRYSGMPTPRTADAEYASHLPSGEKKMVSMTCLLGMAGSRGSPPEEGMRARRVCVGSTTWTVAAIHLPSGTANGSM